MNLSFENQYLTIQMEEGNNLTRIAYKKEGDSINMTNADFKKMFLSYANIIERYSPKKLLLDIRYSKFILDIELQEWTAKKIAPRSTYIKKIAIVTCLDFFTQVSVEQLMQEEELASYGTKPHYFATLKEAERWIKS